MTIRRASAADIPRMTAILAAAFSTDPPLTYLLEGHDREKRERLLQRYFGTILPLYLARGVSHIAGDDGVAVWAAPGRWPFPQRQQLRILPMLTRVFGRHPVRGLKATAVIERGHPHEPHWYLDFIAVAPHAQGKGTGGALLAAMLADCDAESMPAYLNAGSSRSRDLYLRHGFRTTEEFSLPPAGPPLFRMWREPRAGQPRTRPG